MNLCRKGDEKIVRARGERIVSRYNRVGAHLNSQRLTAGIRHALAEARHNPSRHEDPH